MSVGRGGLRRKETRKSQREASLNTHCKSRSIPQNEPIPVVARCPCSPNLPLDFASTGVKRAHGTRPCVYPEPCGCTIRSSPHPLLCIPSRPPLSTPRQSSPPSRGGQSQKFAPSSPLVSMATLCDPPVGLRMKRRWRERKRQGRFGLGGGVLFPFHLSMWRNLCLPTSPSLYTQFL